MLKGFLKAHMPPKVSNEMKCTNNKMTWNTQDTNLSSCYVPKANVDDTLSDQGTGISILHHLATTPRADMLWKTQFWSYHKTNNDCIAVSEVYKSPCFMFSFCCSFTFCFLSHFTKTLKTSTWEVFPVDWLFRGEWDQNDNIPIKATNNGGGDQKHFKTQTYIDFLWWKWLIIL